MHTLMKRDITSEDFEICPICFDEYTFNSLRRSSDTSLIELKGALPESYLQRRVVSLNYAVLRCIIEQRKNHRLPEWSLFIDALYEQCGHPELLPKRD